MFFIRFCSKKAERALNEAEMEEKLWKTEMFEVIVFLINRKFIQFLYLIAIFFLRILIRYFLSTIIQEFTVIFFVFTIEDYYKIIFRIN
jgi:hypothetical protein